MNSWTLVVSLVDLMTPAVSPTTSCWSPGAWLSASRAALKIAA